jgi:anti-anti-sigma factor
LPASSTQAEQHWSCGPLSIVLTSAPGEITVRIEGEFELATTTAARAAFERAIAEDGERIVLDLRPLTFLDSTGVHALVDLHDRCGAASKSLEVRIDDGPVRRVLEVSGVLGMLTGVTAAAVAA